MCNKTDVLDTVYSEVIPRRLYFGGFPKQKHLQQWKERVRGWDAQTIIMIDLTTSDEKHRYRLYPYADIHGTQPKDRDAQDDALSITYFNYPLPDRVAPCNVSEYITFVRWVKDRFLSTSDPIIIHCKGGHGRSGMVIVSLLCVLFGYSIPDAIDRVTQLHHTRPGLHQKYFSQLCPVSRSQQEFLLSVWSSSFPYQDESSLGSSIKSPHHRSLLVI